MKNIALNLTLSLLLSFFSLSSFSQTQLPTPQFCSNNVVGTTCIGTCGSYGEINYTVPQLPLFATKYCVNVVQNSLCPTHYGRMVVYRNNTIVADAVIKPGTQPNLSIKATSGDQIKVVLKAYKNKKSNVVCVWLGNINVELTGK